ncbi:hypothetical protein NI447_11090 [Enterococcus lactis]|nr:hypothetical protein [Enterococcus lactis]
MKSSLFYPEKNLMEFCQENFISRASAMRHLQSLADYVQEFDVISKSELLKKLAELTKHTSLNWSFVGKKKFVFCWDYHSADCTRSLCRG